MNQRKGVCLTVAALAIVLLTGAVPPDDSALLDATKRGDVAAVRSLLGEGADPNVTQGAGLSALHMAAQEGNLEIAKLLLGAGAKVEAKTQIGEYTPLHLASEGAHASIVRALLEVGADPGAVTTTTGVTPLHLAAKTVNGEGAVRELLEHGAAVNAEEASAGQTALMFAASYGRVAAVRELLSHGADPAISTEVVDVLKRMAIDNAAEERLKDAFTEIRKDSPEGTDRALTPADEQAAVAVQREFLRSDEAIAKVLEGFHPDDLAERGFLWQTPACQNDSNSNIGNRVECAEGLRSKVEIGWRPIWSTLVGKSGGMTALMHAARRGQIEAVKALLDGGADIDQVSGDGSSPLVLASLNGWFDLAMLLIERGADPSLATNTDGLSPLFAVLQTRWANYTEHPQPRAHDNQQTEYMEVLDALLAAGADPNVRLKTQILNWEFSQGKGGASGGRFGLDITGATPFWRAAIAQDVEAMKAMAAHGADPHIPTIWPELGMRNGRQSDGRIMDDSGIPRAEGAPNMYPIHAASGGGYLGLAGADLNRVPNNFLNAVTYLVEEHGADVDLPDSWGYTPLFYAAGASADPLIEYLVSKGADVHAMSVLGQSPVDIARGGQAGYFERPIYPETVELLRSFGSPFRCLNTHFRGTGDYCPGSGLERWGALEVEGATGPASVR
jgi:ankyrin repeat protein